MAVRLVLLGSVISALLLVTAGLQRPVASYLVLGILVFDVSRGFQRSFAHGGLPTCLGNRTLRGPWSTRGG